ncbi:helix-turn-helix domain-containing protein [Umezawaea sp. NPDC059074]|uniref:AraC family transcriptional regulator n=1 Tax=Umezawaea sp. NPDC059074 TaxID=3346716 RepID=UPI0036BB4F03
MSYAERVLRVSDELRPWIARVSVATPGTGLENAVLAEPDHATTLALREGVVVVIGPRTRARYHAPKAFRSCVMIRLRPGRAGALGLPVRDLVDRVVPLRDLWGDRDAADVHAVRAALARRAGRDDRGDLAREAIRLLRTGTVRSTARALHVSERHLRAVFGDAVGVSPKHFVRLDRVRTVLAGAGEGRLASLAAEAGYYDQSHMTAEFRDVMGVSPGRFAAGLLPPPAACSGLSG